MPLVALIDGARARAVRGGPRRGSCPGCGREMLAHTGDVIAWHWAHRHDDEAAACATEPETEWHLTWKSRCGDDERVEVPRGARRADVLTPYGWAVEFQHSPMDVREATRRERDWHRRLLWVVDAREAYDGERLTMWRPRGREHLTLRWAWSPAWVREASCRMFLDIGERLVMIGRWFDKNPDRPVMGYGWPLEIDQFARCVLDGRRPPRDPALGRALAPESWVERQSRTDCPTCGKPLAEAARCSAAFAHRGVA